MSRRGLVRSIHVGIVGGVWFCVSCNASGFLPARIEHARTCRIAFRRPLTWSSAPIVMVNGSQGVSEALTRKRKRSGWRHQRLRHVDG